MWCVLAVYKRSNPPCLVAVVSTKFTHDENPLDSHSVLIHHPAVLSAHHSSPPHSPQHQQQHRPACAASQLLAHGRLASNHLVRLLHLIEPMTCPTLPHLARHPRLTLLPPTRSTGLSGNRLRTCFALDIVLSLVLHSLRSLTHTITRFARPLLRTRLPIEGSH